MKLGCFGNTGQIREIEKAGFDFAELDICELVSLSEEEFEEFRAGACAGGLSYDVFSGLLTLSCFRCCQNLSQRNQTPRKTLKMKMSGLFSFVQLLVSGLR